MTSSARHLFYYRVALMVSILAVLPLGYWVRFSGNSAGLHDAFGSVFYEIFWILLAAFCFPQTSLSSIAATVFLLTCGIEFLQLWQPPLLQTIRSTLPGRLFLGTTFNWTDFPAYFVGSGLGWGWGKAIETATKKARS